MKVRKSDDRLQTLGKRTTEIPIFIGIYGKLMIYDNELVIFWCTTRLGWGVCDQVCLKDTSH